MAYRNFIRTFSGLLTISDKILRTVYREFNNIKNSDDFLSIDQEFSLFRKVYKASLELGKTERHSSEEEKNEASLALREEIETLYIDLFKNIYNAHVSNIISDIDDDKIQDTWLYDNDILIWYGSNTDNGGMINKKKRCKYALNLSKIYEYAVKIEKKFTNDDEEVDYPDLLLLKIYEIFKLFAPRRDKKILSLYISNLEGDLGLDDSDDEDNGGGGITGYLSNLAKNVDPKLMSNLANLTSQVTQNLNFEGAPSEEKIKSMMSVENIQNLASKDNINFATSTIKDLMTPDEDGNYNTQKIADKVKEVTNMVKNNINDKGNDNGNDDYIEDNGNDDYIEDKGNEEDSDDEYDD